MTNKEKKLAVLKLAQLQLRNNQEAYMNCAADWAGLCASKNHWDELNPDDGVGSFSLNPIRQSDIDAAKHKEQIYRDFFEDWQDIYNYLLEQLVE
jgi:hypothetical protein